MATGRNGAETASRSQRQDHRAGRPHFILNKFCEISILNLENAGNRQIFVVYGEREPWWCSFRRAMLTHQLAVENRVGERII